MVSQLMIHKAGSSQNWLGSLKKQENRDDFVSSREALSNLEVGMVDIRKGTIRSSKLDFEMTLMFGAFRRFNLPDARQVATQNSRKHDLLHIHISTCNQNKRLLVYVQQASLDAIHQMEQKDGSCELQTINKLIRKSGVGYLSGTQETNIPAGTQAQDSDSDVEEQVIVVHSFPSTSFAAEILSQAEAEIRNHGVYADRDPAGIDSAGGVSAGSPSAGSDPAGGNPAGTFQPAGSYDPAALVLGSSENTTRISSPSYVCAKEISHLASSHPSFLMMIFCYSYKFQHACGSESSPTTRVNTIHPQSQILDQQRTNHTDQLHCLSACFLSQLEPTSIAKALEDPDWVDAMQGRDAKDKMDLEEQVDARVQIEAIRTVFGLLLRYGLFGYQLDVKVVKALYGLHQAPRAWYARLSAFLLQHNYRRGTIDKTLFIKKDSRDILLVQVDNRLPVVFLSAKTSMLKTCLLSFDMESVRTATTPYEAAKTKLKEKLDPQVMYICYRSMIVKKIFKYLKGQPKLACRYPKDFPFSWKPYSDVILLVSWWTGQSHYRWMVNFWAAPGFFHGSARSRLLWLLLYISGIGRSSVPFWLVESLLRELREVVNTATRCTFFLLTGLVSVGRTMVLLVVILSAGRWVFASRTMVSAWCYPSARDVSFSFPCWMLVFAGSMDYAADSVYLLKILYVVNGVLASGVDMVLEKDFAGFALQEMEIHPLIAPNPNSFNDPPNIFTHPPQPPERSILCVNYVGNNASLMGYNCPLWEPLYPIDQSPPQEMSIQDMELQKQQEVQLRLDELKGKFNGMSIEINKKKELQQQEQAANLSTYTTEPSRCFNSFYDDDDYEESIIPLNEIVYQIPPSIHHNPTLLIKEPEDSLT
ncbi:putative ribonuclease H-like domain-containing protein [Tanacetum coccineum]|uniref:Ribonuclease H-like domain-containing protein n=1 Tax=Tanacetum coccineum TaxID=301880 RepID=A0ABQ5E0B9_9ASTR